MSIKIIQDKLKTYNPTSFQEEENAIKEITQEVALSGLSRGGFFKEAIFHGGTCLRIFHGLNRFSEDLDFALRSPDINFSFDYYLKKISKECSIYGYELEIRDRSKADEIVKKAFIKDSSIGKQLSLNYPSLSGMQKKINIKLELDTNPPPRGHFQASFHNFPLPFSVTTYTLPCLFAGKLHALLCRKYQKGRDWYDFLWYRRFDVKPDIDFLASSLLQTGHVQKEDLPLSISWVQSRLVEKIKTIDWDKLREDIKRFVKKDEIDSINHWSADLFLQVTEGFSRMNFYPPMDDDR